MCTVQTTPKSSQPASIFWFGLDNFIVFLQMTLVTNFFLFFFLAASHYADVPRPESELAPQQQPKPLQGQHWIPNWMSHQGTPLITDFTEHTLCARHWTRWFPGPGSSWGFIDFFFFLLYFIGVYLIFNVVVVSGV